MAEKDLSTQRYSPAMTAQVRAQNIREIVLAKRAMLQKSPDRINLQDINEVKDASDAYLQHCIEHSVLPSFQGLAAFFGVSRMWLYRFLDQHRESLSGKYLEKLRALFSDCRIVAADRGSCPESLTIFLLKNGNEGYADRVELTPVEPTNPFAGLNADDARKRLLMGIPDYDDDEEL